MHNFYFSVIIGPKYPALSLHDMETMQIQMVGCKTCKVTAHEMYLDFLDRVVLIGNNDNKNNKYENIKGEEPSSARVHDVGKLIILCIIDLFFRHTNNIS